MAQPAAGLRGSYPVEGHTCSPPSLAWCCLDIASLSCRDASCFFSGEKLRPSQPHMTPHRNTVLWKAWSEPPQALGGRWSFGIEHRKHRQCHASLAMPPREKRVASSWPALSTALENLTVRRRS